MPPRHRPAAALAAACAAALVLAGCAAGHDWFGPRPAPSAVGTLEPGFTDQSATPAPESTLTPAPGSWDAVRPSGGFRVVLLVKGEDKPTETLRRAVLGWAEEEGVSLMTMVADAADPTTSIDKAVELRADLIICVGNELVDPLATATPHFLDQQFLVIGAELAEPTSNVTSADWDGASFRGQGLEMSSPYDPTTFTPERAARAVRAGVAAVLHGLTGIVIWLR